MRRGLTLYPDEQTFSPGEFSIFDSIGEADNEGQCSVGAVQRWRKAARSWELNLRRVELPAHKPQQRLNGSPELGEAERSGVLTRSPARLRACGAAQTALHFEDQY